MPTANAKNPLFKAGFFIVSFNQYWAKVLLSCQVHLKKRHDVHQTNPDWHSQVATKSLIFLDSAVFILLHEQHHFFISVINSIGFNHQTLHAWLSSWGLAWLIGFPTVLLVLPLARKLALCLVKTDTN